METTLWDLGFRDHRRKGSMEKDMELGLGCMQVSPKGGALTDTLIRIQDSGGRI